MLSQLAWRNLWRNRRRSLITLSAMVFGLFACLVTFAFGDGAHLQMIRVATSTYLGHIQLNRKGFHKNQKIELVISEKSKPIKLLKEAVAAQEKKGEGSSLASWQRRVEAWTPRLFGAGLVSTGRYSSGGLLLGLDLDRESRVTHMPDSVLKAMAREALKSGKYKKRLPSSYLQDIQSRLGCLKKIKGNKRQKKQETRRCWHRALHEATRKLSGDRPLYEKTLAGLIRQREVALGKGLAVALKAQIGDFMAVVTQAYDGSMGNDRYTVVAIIESGNADMDISLCLMPLKQLQELLVLQGYYHTVVLHLNTDNGFFIRRTARQFADSLQKAGLKASNKPSKKADKVLPGTKPSWEVLPWQRVSPELYEFIRADEAGQYVMVLIVFFLVAFIILNTLQMSIMERTREFGVLMSIGFKGSKLVKLIVLEGVFLALITTVAGLILGLPVMAYLQAYGIPIGEPLQMGGIVLDLRIEGKITIQGLLFSPAVVFLTTLIVSFYPAYRATRLEPARALRHV